MVYSIWQRSQILFSVQNRRGKRSPYLACPNALIIAQMFQMANGTCGLVVGQLQWKTTPPKGPDCGNVGVIVPVG